MCLFRKKKTSLSQPGAVRPAPAAPSARPGRVLSGAVVSDIGRLRGNNEDNFVLSGGMNAAFSDREEAMLAPRPCGEGWEIAAVFDGMGGGEKGEQAAGAAASALLAAAETARGLSREELDTAIRAAVREANDRVVALQKTAATFGTTSTVLCTDGCACKLYHLGDSRAYLLRDGELRQLTRDHTISQMKREIGLLRAGESAPEAEKHQLTNYIGRDKSGGHLHPEESGWLPLRGNDRVLLCSDGLYDELDDERIRSLLAADGEPLAQARRLVFDAAERGGRDNITCLILHVTDGAETADKEAGA